MTEKTPLSLTPFEIFIENEQKYISYLIKVDSQDCIDFDDKFFINKKLKIIFQCIQDLTLENIKIDIDILFDKVKQNINEIQLSDIKLIVESYSDFDNIGIVKKRIKENYLKQVSTKGILENVLRQTTVSGDLDIEKLKTYNSNLSDIIFDVENESSKLLSFEDVIEKEGYRKLLENRNLGIGRRTLGFRCIDNMLTYPGEPGDITTIALYKGFGKCLEKNTLLLTENGFKYIGDFSKNIKGFTDDVNEKLKVANRDMILPEKFYEEDTSKTIKIKIKHGLEIEGTPEHPVLIFNEECEYEYKNLEDIKIGDYVCIFNNTNVFPKKNKKIEFTYEKKQPNVKDVLIPKYVSLNLSRLLGYFVANGTFSNNSIFVSTLNEKIKKDITDILAGFELTKGKVSSNKGVRISSSIFVSFLKYLIGKKSSDKFTARYKCVPEFILQGTKEIQLEFIKALFDCGSWASDSILEYYTASKQLCKEIQLMLLNMGIFSFVGEKYLEKYEHTYYSLIVTGEDFDRYKEFINYKSNKYDFKKVNIKRNTNIKIIPYLKDKIFKNLMDLRNRLKVSQAGICYSEDFYKKRFKLYNAVLKSKTITKNFTYYNLNAVYDILKAEKGYHACPEIKESINLIENVLKTDYLYFPVIEKTEVNENKTVYDFVIPEHHNFYSNGIISHNSTLLLNIANSLINSGIPFVYFCLDMGYMTIMDRLMCLRGRMSNTELLQQDKDDALKDRIEKELQRLIKIKNFNIYPEGSLSLDDFEAYIPIVQKKFRQNGSFKNGDEYFVCGFDTIDMVDDFSGYDTIGIKAGINKQSSILKKYGIHAINLNQINENQLRAKKPKTIEDVENIKFTREDIEGSASFASRSRVVIMGNRVTELKRLLFPEEEDLISLEDDLMQLTIVKQNDGKVGRIKPKLLFDHHTFSLYEFNK